MAVKVNVRTSADTKALENYQKELDETRKKLIQSGKPLNEFTKEMRKLDSQQRTLNKLTPQTTARFGKLKDMFGGFVITAGDVVNGLKAVGRAAWGAVQDASALTEAQNKVAQVFDESIPAVREFGENAAESIGMSERAALAATGTYGNLFRAFGIGEQAAATMSMELVELAADLASFNDTSIDDALTALRSGLSGETEPLKRFGVALNDARLKQEALSLGIYDGVGMLNANQKAQAAYVLIMKDTALAQGDFARNSDELANALRSTEGAWEDFKAAFGEGIMGESAEGASALSQALRDMQPAARWAGDAIAYVMSNTYDLFYQAGAQIGDMTGSLDEFSQASYDAWKESGKTAEVSLREFRAEMKENLAVLPGLHTLTNDTASATSGLAGATKDATGADQDATAAKQELVRAMDGQKVAADDLQGIERTLAEMTNDAAQADIAAADALDDYNEAVKKHGEKSREAEKAKLRLEDANWRAADATADLRAKEEELSTTLTEASKNAAYERWLIGMRDRARELATALGSVGYQSGAIAGRSGSGGRVLKNAAGGWVSEPSFSTLAENNYPEAVITTEPAYRSRSLRLYDELGDRLGVDNSRSISIAPGAVVIHANGGGDAYSIAAAVESALQRVVRSASMMGA